MDFLNIKNLIYTLTIITIMSCSSSNNQDVNTLGDFSQVLDNIANNVIVKTYTDLASKSETLVSKINALKDNKSDATLTAARNAWKETRVPWELSEAFLLGPVDTKGIDPAIDSWPVNVTDMDTLLKDVTAHPLINEDKISRQGDEAKGFHLIEYLLWGVDGNKALSAFTRRELEYLVAASQNLKTKTAELKNAWTGTDGYVSHFLNAGKTSTVYKSQKSAIEDLVTGMITIANEVATGKIEEPLNGKDGTGLTGKPELEESRFSHNSKKDFANNIRGVQNVYLGSYAGVTGKGISNIITSKNSTLDNQFKTELSEAIAAIEAIPGTFTIAIASNREKVKEAQQKVQKVHDTLNQKIKPLISNL